MTGKFGTVLDGQIHYRAVCDVSLYDGAGPLATAHEANTFDHVKSMSFSGGAVETAKTHEESMGVCLSVGVVKRTPRQ